MCYRNASGGVIDQQAVIIDGTSQVAVNLWINDITENACSPYVYNTCLLH